MESKISVIIPVYNAEKFLDSCLDSISNQTYKNLQIILVDDGSKDSSREICKYGDAKSRSIAKQNIKVAKENLNYLKFNNPLIKKLSLIKKIVKLVYSGLRLRSVI